MKDNPGQQELYDLKTNIAPHLTRFLREIETFKSEIFTVISENYELKLPSRKGYMQVRPYEIERGTEENKKIEHGYDFWILINERTYALQFIINLEGKINVMIYADGRVKSHEGPFWCWDHFSKIEDTTKHKSFVDKIFTWLTVPEVFDLLGFIVEYVDCKELRQ